MHESLDREDDIKVGTERGFGSVFACVFVMVGLWPLLDGAPIRWWAFIVAAVFIVCAFLIPIALRPLNILWFKIGMLMYKVVNPLTMAMLYYFTVVPMGLVMKMFGKDPLSRSFDKTVSTYWIDREPPGPEPESMKYQF